MDVTGDKAAVSGATPTYRIPRQRHAHEPVGPANGGADRAVGWRSSLTCPAGSTTSKGTVVGIPPVGDRGDRFAVPRWCPRNAPDRIITGAATTTVIVPAGVAGAISYSY